FHSVFDDASPDVYTGQSIFDLDGAVDYGLLHSAAAELLRRHSTLRSCFRQRRSGEWAQLVLREVEPDWREVDLRNLPTDEQLTEADRLIDAERMRHFDLNTPPLVRFLLLRLAGSQARFVITSHHVAFDGWSLPVVVRDLFQLYAAGANPAALPPARGYRDFLTWLASRDNDEAMHAWTNALADLDGPTLVAPNASRIPVLPQEIEFELSTADTTSLVRWARDHGLTLNTVIEGAWALVLSQLTGRDDIVTGITVSGRPPELEGVESIVGLFINTVPLRLHVRPTESLTTMLTRLQQEQTKLIPHQHIGLSHLQQLAGLPGGTDLFDTLCVFQNYPSSGAGWAQLAAAAPIVAVHSRSASHYPLVLLVGPGKQLKLQLNYRPDVLEKPDATTIANRLQQVLQAIQQNPQQLTAHLPTLHNTERRHILETW
ncbi:condensation domain-containing protein, partial [Pilimelia columellifera]|uniref:condensation domain-containing protein n=1 Tax=Pilimelia columellifera TaxID=706574 RepID=UPI0031DC5665